MARELCWGAIESTGRGQDSAQEGSERAEKITHYRGDQSAHFEKEGDRNQDRVLGTTWASGEQTQESRKSVSSQMSHKFR